MWLNCKVIKTLQPPISTSTPLFQVYPTFLTNNFEISFLVNNFKPPPSPPSPQVTPFLEGKVYKSQSPKYLFNIIPFTLSTYNTRNTNDIPQFKVNHNFFGISFISSVAIKWNKLDLNIHHLEYFSYVLLQVVSSIVIIPEELNY